MKPCKKCGVEKDLTEFDFAPKNRDGRSGTCSACRREIERQRRRTVEFHNLPHQRRAWADQMMKLLRINARDY